MKGVEVLEKMNEEVEFGFQKVEQDQRCWGFKKYEWGSGVWVSKIGTRPKVLRLKKTMEEDVKFGFQKVE